MIFHCVYVPHLSYPFVCWWTSRLLSCISVYVVGYFSWSWRSGLLLEMPYAAQQHTLLLLSKLHALGVPLRGLCRSFCCGKLTLQGVWQAWLSPSPVGCQMLLCVDAGGWWLVGHSLLEAGCRTPGVPQDSCWFSRGQSHRSIDSEAYACPLVGGAMPQPSGGQGPVYSTVCRWLWAQGVFRQLVCLLVGLCSCPVSCLPWGHPAVSIRCKQVF